jgi:hypothetical protein
MNNAILGGDLKLMDRPGQPKATDGIETAQKLTVPHCCSNIFSPAQLQAAIALAS